MNKSENRSTKPATPNKVVAELDGFVDLGMKREALRLVRRQLKEKPIAPDTLYAAVNAIVTIADTCKPWRPLVEAAHQTLSERGKRHVRFMMLSFYISMGDHGAAYPFIAGQFSGTFAPVDLMFGIQTLIALGRVDEAKRLVRKAVKAMDHLADPDGRAMLMNSMAAYFSEIHDWEPAIKLWELLQQDHLMAESAILGLVQLHLQRTLETISSGRKALNNLRQNHDPQLETSLPGNDAIRWQKTEKQLLKIERHVNRGLKDAGCDQSH